tara:strand:+ start:26 stop:250 length:225 start_codon:yes stop_codon:yes gene_type:complete
MSKKIPNKEEEEPIVSEVDGDIEEGDTHELEDTVLSCLFELELLTKITKEKISMIEDRINNLRLSIHGEDINEY